MSDVERMLNELIAYDDYRLNLLAQAILQMNKQANHTLLEPELEMRLYENFQYTFGEDYTENQIEECRDGARINDDTGGEVNELEIEVSRPDGNCLDCKFQYLEDSDYWCSICPGNPEDI